LLQDLGRKSGGANDVEVALLVQHPYQRFAEKAVFSQQEYVNHGVAQRSTGCRRRGASGWLRLAQEKATIVKFLQNLCYFGYGPDLPTPARD
jgi:hypothetical protein